LLNFSPAGTQTLLTKITFRADAYDEIGTGHVMRCLALANACRKMDIATCFISRIKDETLLSHIKQHGHEIKFITKGLENNWFDYINSDVDWVVLDGYHFDLQDHRRIHETGAKLLVVDDMAKLDEYEADIILNQNFHADTKHYPATNRIKMLMGPRYALLRNEFVEYPLEPRRSQAHRLLITLGGSDPLGISLLVLDALSKINHIKFEVLLIAGSSNPHFNQLQDTAKQIAQLHGHLIDVQRYTDNMPAVMAWSDLAIIAGGSTTLEVAYMGLPSLVLTLAENQTATVIAMQKLGIAESLGWYNVLDAKAIAFALNRLANDEPRRRSMGVAGQNLVDGLGAVKVIEIMLET
jgi:UDP-2,4-diacetamido-2,4,6-trideoxy-beta-L-altropyranose hydrolase